MPLNLTQTLNRTRTLYYHQPSYHGYPSAYQSLPRNAQRPTPSTFTRSTLDIRHQQHRSHQQSNSRRYKPDTDQYGRSYCWCSIPFVILWFHVPVNLYILYKLELNDFFAKPKWKLIHLVITFDANSKRNTRIDNRIPSAHSVNMEAVWSRLNIST